MLSFSQRVVKRGFDLVFSIIGLCLSGWIIFFAWIIASFETKSNGFFIQKRVGKDAKIFVVFKIKTMKKISGLDSTITTKNDKRISKSGAFFRRTKIDELPQLLNILLGDMSFVGPRPDVEGYADKLKGDDRVILSILPGITGPATLKYRDEESLLASVENPEEYNDTIIWKDKVAINKEYIKNYSFFKDIEYLIKTLKG
jgi:lipopolysaccharide/colanic/teichoic acid biosynthesis glycosyltransferase